jgi:hypothetical protein
MKLARMIAMGASAIGLAAGGAFAAEDRPGVNDESAPETYVLLVPADAGYYDVYGVDEDGDGVIDGYLVIEESDTLG